MFSALNPQYQELYLIGNVKVMTTPLSPKESYGREGVRLAARWRVQRTPMEGVFLGNAQKHTPPPLSRGESHGPPLYVTFFHTFQALNTCFGEGLA